ncbi:MAG: glycoside hydrolase family 78 protein [Tannerellaceae bacterium]|nr:glycoside hydrolase family 78 protein [Tannerellaceae bacterium]
MNYSIINLFFVLQLCVLASCSTMDIRIANLRCEYMENPLCVESAHPMLQWQLLSEKQGKRQSAYHIIVSSDSSLVDQNQGDCWDSGKVLSSESLIRYQGKELSSTEQVYWKVMVWDEKDSASEWSDKAEWTMGLLHPSDWKAQWIGDRVDMYPDSTLTFPAPYFRKEFRMGKPVKKAMAYVCGLGFYELYMNGRKAGDQVLAPAVTNYDKRSLRNLLYYYDDQSTQRVLYNVFNVTNLLKKEDNAIGMVLGNGWYNQRDRIVEGFMWYDVPKMILQLDIDYEDGTNETVVSDESWKTATGPLLRDAIFTGEVYDARKDLGQWNRVLYEDTGWKSALTVRPPTGVMRAQTVQFNKIMNIVDTRFEQVDDSTYLFTLPETVSGWCALNVEGKAGDEVRLRFVSEEGLDYGQTDTYILKGGGKEEWEPRFTWHTFRWVEATTKGVKLSKESLSVKNIYTDVMNTGTFECSNELFNRIVKAYDRTLRANFKGIISSDPHRERLAYTGDGQVITESLLYSYDMTRFLRKFIDDMDDARNKITGYVPHTAPFSGGGGGPAWGSAYVIIPWAYYCHYGDTAVLRKHYEGMKQWIGYLGTRTDDRGLVVREEPNGWCLGEWCTLYNHIEIPTELVNTAYYYHITRIMMNVVEVLGEKEDETAFADLAKTIKKNFNAAFFNPVTHHYWEGRQGADVFALGFGLVPDNEQEAVFSALAERLATLDYHFDTGIFGTPLLLKVLTENGCVDLAYTLMNQRNFPGYAYLLDDKNSTLWETWDGGGDPGGCGHCHPMFGSVVSWFYESLAGIKPDKYRAGMKHFYIAPAPIQDLSYCKASYVTLYGKIASEWKVDEGGNLELWVEVPANTSATVILPKWGNTPERKPVEILSGSHHFTVLK